MVVRACDGPCCLELVGEQGRQHGTHEIARCARGSATKLVGTWRSAVTPHSRLVELVDHILKCDLVAFLGVGLHSWAAVVNVCR
jgi:hypothetical protein